MIEKINPFKKKEETRSIELVDIDSIYVPAERVTSVWDPELEKEFIESIKVQGILEPIALLDIEGELWLIDGLHRIQAAEKLGMKKVPAIVKKGTLTDLLIENIIRNRQRGKSNAAQEAQVLRILVQQQGLTLTQAAHKMGMSESWARTLLKVSELPQAVLDYVGRGFLPVSGALFLTYIRDPQAQLDIATDAVKWGYTADQIKFRVYAELGRELREEDKKYEITPTGEIRVLPPLCFICHTELTKEAPYRWFCPSCLDLITDFREEWEKRVRESIESSKEEAATS